MNVDEPQLPRKRRRSVNQEIGQTEGSFPDDPKSHYRRIYYEVLDLLVAGITLLFHQPGYKAYRNIQTVLTTAHMLRLFLAAFQMILRKRRVRRLLTSYANCMARICTGNS